MFFKGAGQAGRGGGCFGAAAWPPPSFSALPSAPPQAQPGHIPRQPRHLLRYRLSIAPVPSSGKAPSTLLSPSHALDTLFPSLAPAIGPISAPRFKLPAKGGGTTRSGRRRRGAGGIWGGVVDEVRYRGEAGDGRVFGNHDGALGAGPFCGGSGTERDEVGIC